MTNSTTTAAPTASPLEVLDLRDCDGTGYIVAWDRHTRQATIRLFDFDEMFFEKASDNLADGEMHYPMTTPRSVAWAVEADSQDGYQRENFQDGYAHVAAIDLTMDFDLAEPGSSDLIRCSLEIPEHVGDSEVWRVEFTMCSAGLLEATERLGRLL